MLPLQINSFSTIVQQVINNNSGLVLMDYLIKQSRRVKFSTQQNAEGPGSSKALQKTPSLREEKNRPQNWFGRQKPWQMNQAYDSNEVDKATAVAAATYAVISVTDSTIPDKKTLGGYPKPSITPIKSQKEAPKVSSPQPADTSTHKESSVIQEEEAETAVKVVVGPSPSVTRSPTSTDKPKVKKVPTFADDQLSTRKQIQPAESLKLKTDPVPEIKTPKSDFPTSTDKPKVKKFPTFADDQLSTRKQIQPAESLKLKTDPVPEIKKPKSDFPTVPKPALSPAKMDRQASTKISGGTEADSWERAQLAKIKKRYEDVESRVVSWENEKKKKSRRRLDKTEKEIERKRLKAMERFRSEIEDINQIVDGARSKAKERRRHDELKAKEKANTYRKTGTLPTSCFCF
ncbi:uncharacterized protein [Euphorbia lathyris]|uniref:uncharacterized protein n=1 Tax=Euphorbia lathyris TaxID=212925 RepID=UPI0033138C67